MIPPDAWTRIASFLATDELVRLWLTGGKEVRMALGRMGGMREFVMEVEFPFVIERLPLTILNCLPGLQTLHLQISKDPMTRPHRHVTIAQLQALPSGITDLRLDFVECLADAHVPHLPPRLTTLALPCNRSLSHFGISSLPKSITDLNLARNSNVSLYNLPPHIENLVAPISIRPGELLPPTLVSLEITDGGYYRDLNAESLSLPASLTRLRLPEPAFWTLDRVSVLNEFLPLNLLQLNLPHCSLTSELLISLLPHTLRVLKLGWDLETPPNLTDAIAPLLPKGLRYLSIMPFSIPSTYQDRRPLFSHMSSAMLPSLPAKLHTLHIWVLHSLPDTKLEAEFKLLPQGLTDLDIRIGVTEHMPAFSSLPPHLTKCTIRPYNHWLAPDIDLQHEQLPKVTHIQVGLANDIEKGYLSLDLPTGRGRSPTRWPSSLKSLRSADTFNHVSLFNLPSTLTKLELYGDERWTDERVPLLPDGLKHFCILGVNHIGDEGLPALPHELESLRLPCNESISLTKYSLPTSLRELELIGAPMFAFENLPPNLTSFVSANSTINDDIFALFPRTITSLALNGTHRVTGACLQHLNPAMYRLEIRYGDFEDEDIEHLPRRLHIFSVPEGSHDLSDECCQLLPPLLSYLDIPGTFFTDDGIKLLPRCLQTLLLKDAHHLTYKALDHMPRRLKTIGVPCRWDAQEGDAITVPHIIARFPGANVVDH